mgnify:CR=1 FL=1
MAASPDHQAPSKPTYNLIAWLFLRAFGVIFLIAFYSFSREALGLIGSHGIQPVAELLVAANAQLGATAYWVVPTVFWVNASDITIQCVGWAGMVFSVLLILNVLPRLSLTALYVLYLSLVYGGQVFMTFQWDMLLLETALIAFFFIRYRTLGIWLLRWLVFRFIFVSGMVKIMSGDPSWWDLTALNYHFLTQPLPTPLAWYANYLPEMLLKFGTASTLFIELVIPFLIFMTRRLRMVAAFAILLLQLTIMSTGNYNFFNLTAIVLCLSLFDDAALQCLIPARLLAHMQQRVLPKPPFMLMNILAAVFTVVTIFLSLVQFNQRFIGVFPAASAAAVRVISPLMVVSTYGPFAVMTKKRHEIIIEGSNDGVTWREYHFKYKPGNIYRGPLWNTPLQPRVDWQMWFAALGPVNASPWFQRFLQRLLQNEPAVTDLLLENPFPDLPPVFVRALFFDYRYTTNAEYKETGASWDRTLVGVYFPAASL